MAVPTGETHEDFEHCSLASITLAALLTVVTNGSMLVGFNSVAQNADLEQRVQAPTLVTLDTVTVMAHQS